MALGDQTRRHIMTKKAGMRALLLDIATDLQHYAQGIASWVDRTGEARKGIRGGVKTSRGGFTLYLEHTVWYARFLETGTQPHEIEPELKKALHWPGADRPVGKVMHPGIKSYAVLVPTADANIDDITKAILDYWRG
ncbi:hypothetical protein [Desulfovirgula thermocuniculi]|uniref:hypothetical protein n=1 Tax=Desulfovirgula thermocuniculi TaxID=348842 RepID=UPI000487D84F|nr:hypothetical protein [Desulfovirgula thermocuniculi]